MSNGMITGRCETGRVYVDGRELSPERSLLVRSHSPDGFAWGYEGSGPAQLALALLLHAGVPERDAEAHYQGLKRQVIARWPTDQDFAWTVDELKRWVANVVKTRDQYLCLCCGKGYENNGTSCCSPCGALEGGECCDAWTRGAGITIHPSPPPLGDWVCCDERLPVGGRCVLIWDGHSVAVAYALHSPTVWRRWGSDFESANMSPTHWASVEGVPFRLERETRIIEGTWLRCVSCDARWCASSSAIPARKLIARLERVECPHCGEREQINVTQARTGVPE